MTNTATPVVDVLPLLNIGEVLRRAGACTQADIDKACEKMAKHPQMKLGEALVSIGACTVVDVALALERQRRLVDGADETILTLGEILSDGYRAARRATRLSTVALAAAVA